MTGCLLRADQLAIGRGDRTLVADLSLAIAPGTLTHLRGRNGAGKTSLLEVLAGLRAPLAGHVERDARGLHWLGHKNALNGDLSAVENLAFWCALHEGDAALIVPSLDTLGLARLRHRPCRALSAGQKRRVALARLLLAPRPLWLLDEPLSAIDAEGLERVATVLGRHLDGGGAALVTSHQALAADDTRLRVLDLG